MEIILLVYHLLVWLRVILDMSTLMINQCVMEQLRLDHVLVSCKGIIRHMNRAKQKGGLGIIFGNFFFHAKVMSTYSTSIREILVPI